MRVVLLLAASGAAIAAIAACSGWRVALAGAVAAGVIAATRMRFSALVAVVGLLVVLALAATGRTAGSDERPHAAERAR